MRRTKEEAAQTRENILHAATILFAQKGFNKTSLEEVAREAGVTRGAVYWHFKNKLEIFDALFEHMHVPLVTMITQDMKHDHPHPLKQLEELCLKLFYNLEEDKSKRYALDIFLIRNDYSGDLAPYKQKHFERRQEKIDMLLAYFQRAQQKGQLSKEADPVLLRDAVLCFLKGILIDYLHNYDDSMQTKIPALIKMFISNLPAMT